MNTDARPQRRERMHRSALTPSPPPTRPASPDQQRPRDAAAASAPRFAQLDLVTKNRSAREYVVPDHSVGEQWPGRQKATKQLSLFESGVAKRQAARAAKAGEDAGRRRRRKQREPAADAG